MKQGSECLSHDTGIVEGLVTAFYVPFPLLQPFWVLKHPEERELWLARTVTTPATRHKIGAVAILLFI